MMSSPRHDVAGAQLPTGAITDPRFHDPAFEREIQRRLSPSLRGIRVEPALHPRPA
jgi:hypothetical protein